MRLTKYVPFVARPWVNGGSLLGLLSAVLRFDPTGKRVACFVAIVSMVMFIAGVVLTLRYRERGPS